MNCLVWNCRGLGNQRTVRALRELIRKEDPSLVKLNVNWGISKSENNNSGCLELHCGGSEG